MAARDDLTLREVRKRHILITLARTGWDVKTASALLKVTERYLAKEIKKLGLQNPKAWKRG
jgi:transcriptional regulator with GAF, ATPase, and Fis domain